MLPEPALTFTIPSIHDGIALDCRVYHPASLAAGNVGAPPWKKHTAIVAHPYAPMGGCYDDPVLESVAAKLLRTGYLVGTFNFRGAGHSAGRTSWTAKPERDDYTSFVGFIVHYIHYLDPFRDCGGPSNTKQSDATQQQLDAQASATASESHATHITTDSSNLPVLLLGGYSYGAMITTQLEPLERLLAHFESPDTDSDAAQIRLRAQHLADQQNTILGGMRKAMLQSRNLHSPTKRASAMRIGGDEGGSPRRSHDSHGKRSFSLDTDDKLRRGVHDFMAKRKAKHDGHGHGHNQHWPLHHRSASGTDMSKQNAATTNPSNDKAQHGASDYLAEAEAEGDAPAAEKLPAVELLPLRTAYFVVSPLQGLVNHLATMTLVPSRMRHQQDESAEMKLVCNPTLAVYGDKDVFVSASKLRDWTAKLTAKENSQFRAVEVSPAGHFWIEEGALQKMNHEIEAFAASLIHND